MGNEIVNKNGWNMKKIDNVFGQIYWPINGYAS